MTFQSSLTPLQVAAMVTDIANGMSKTDAAKKYGISLRTVYRKLKLPDTRPGVNTKYLTHTPKPCGTNAAYRMHRYRGETACTACLAAHAKNVQKNKRKRKREQARTSDLARRQRGEVRDISA